jgi:ABC-2 type transport system ATP-binding protein
VVTDMPSTAAISVELLTKRHDERTVLDKVSSTVPLDSVTGFLGPDGAGKTTTLRIAVWVLAFAAAG